MQEFQAEQDAWEVSPALRDPTIMPLEARLLPAQWSPGHPAQWAPFCRKKLSISKQPLVTEVTADQHVCHPLTGVDLSMPFPAHQLTCMYCRTSYKKRNNTTLNVTSVMRYIPIPEN